MKNIDADKNEDILTCHLACYLSDCDEVVIECVRESNSTKLKKNNERVKHELDVNAHLNEGLFIKAMKKKKRVCSDFTDPCWVI